MLSGGEVGKKSFTSSLLISSECFAAGVGFEEVLGGGEEVLGGGEVLGAAEEVLAAGCGGDTGSSGGGDTGSGGGGGGVEARGGARAARLAGRLPPRRRLRSLAALLLLNLPILSLGMPYAMYGNR